MLGVEWFVVRWFVGSMVHRFRQSLVFVFCWPLAPRLMSHAMRQQKCANACCFVALILFTSRFCNRHPACSILLHTPTQHLSYCPLFAVAMCRSLTDCLNAIGSGGGGAASWAEPHSICLRLGVDNKYLHCTLAFLFELIDSRQIEMGAGDC